jgi:hypothetical protein
MKKFYFSFAAGSGMRHYGKYFVIEAEDMSAARAEMFDKFGDRWAFVYESAEKCGVVMYNLELAVYDADHERASGELNDMLMDGDAELNDKEIEWLEKFRRRQTLSPKMIQTIDGIYSRRM